MLLKEYFQCLDIKSILLSFKTSLLKLFSFKTFSFKACFAFYWICWILTVNKNHEWWSSCETALSCLAELQSSRSLVFWVFSKTRLYILTSNHFPFLILISEGFAWIYLRIKRKIKYTFTAEMMLKSLSNSEVPSNFLPAYINIKEYFIIVDFSVLVALPN